MTDVPTCEWLGISGKKYTYYVYPIGQKFTAGPGNYIFVKENPTTWSAIYVGETDDISTRFDNHEKLPCVRKYNGTHIHVHSSSKDKSVRTEEEADIRKKYDPPCNKE